MFEHGNLVTPFRYHNRLPGVVSLGFALAAAVKFSASTVIILGQLSLLGYSRRGKKGLKSSRDKNARREPHWGEGEEEPAM